LEEIKVNKMAIKIQKALRKSQRSVINTGEGLTEQAHKDDCDINYILRNYQKTGLIKHAKNNQGKYDDISAVDFSEAMIIVAQAKSMFEELPANMRKRFGNDPGAFLNFVQTPGNEAEMVKMGIARGNDGIDVSGAPTGAPVHENKPATEGTAETAEA
jgi:phage internal scaffolding protein